MKRKVETLAINDRTIEYSMIGEGEPILVMHGGHSNCYEEFGYKALLDQGYCIITPSRAGYGKTSSDIGHRLLDACHHYMKLLDYLEIRQVHLIGVSAGGPSAIKLASAFPQRIKTLTLQSAVTKEWLTPKDITYKIANILFRPATEKIAWKLISSFNNRFPHFIFKQMFSSFSTLSYKEASGMIGEEDVEEIRKMNARQRSGHGFLKDLMQTKEVAVEDLKAITCPTLIMASYHDSSVPIEHAHHASTCIASSKICFVDTWGHLIWIGKGAAQVDKHMIEFLRDYVINS